MIGDPNKNIRIAPTDYVTTCVCKAFRNQPTNATAQGNQPTQATKQFPEPTNHPTNQ